MNFDNLNLYEGFRYVDSEISQELITTFTDERLYEQRRVKITITDEYDNTIAIITDVDSPCTWYINDNTKFGEFLTSIKYSHFIEGNGKRMLIAYDESLKYRNIKNIHGYINDLRIIKTFNEYSTHDNEQLQRIINSIGFYIGMCNDENIQQYKEDIINSLNYKDRVKYEVSLMSTRLHEDEDEDEYEDEE